MSLTDITDTPLPQLSPRRPDSHKGDYGRALLVGGSRGMAGAIALAGQATLRSGAGLVTLAVPRPVQDVVASLSACYMTHGLGRVADQITKRAATAVLGLEAEATAVGIGPGLGRSDETIDFVQLVYKVGDRPTVVDADALFALAGRKAALSKPGGPRILTPHPGEFARLTDARLENRVEAAAELALRDATNQTVVVLKGHRTVVTDGNRYSVNQTGNPGMATGGSGDVLTGVITGLLCQGLEPFDAARLGVHVHGLAGDLAAAELGQVSLIASDLVEYLPQAFVQLSS